MKRILTFALVLVLLCGCVSGVSAVSPRTIHLEKTLNRFAQTRSDFSLIPVPQSRSAEDPVYVESVSDGASVIRGAMTAREESCAVYVALSEWSDELLLELADAFFVEAFRHTRKPNEGDYLLVTLYNAGVAVDGFVEDDIGYFVFYYEMEYLTTAAQEQQVDAAVKQILDQLKVNPRYVQDKLQTIYDYLWENIRCTPVDENSEDLLYHTAYNGLVNGATSCCGISAIVYRLVLEAGQDCRIITGTRNGADRLWNIIRIGPDFYHMDAANDGEPYGKYFLKGNSGMTGYQRDEAFTTEAFVKKYPVPDEDFSKDTCKHSYSSKQVHATCTERGYTLQLCKFCGYSYQESYVEATGHQYGQWELVVAPTCTKNGKQQRKCNQCDATESKTVLSLGHQYEDGACTECGRRLPEGMTVPQKPVVRSCYSVVQTSMKTTWNLVDGVDGYELWRSSTPEDPLSWTKVKTINSPTQDRYTNQGLTVGVTYYYKVRAFVNAPDGSKVYSPFSEMNFQPAAVVISKVVSQKPDRILLNWNKVDGCHGYQIWRLQDNGKWKLIKTLGDKGNTLTDDQGDATAYTNSGLTAGSVQTYKMRAFRIREDGKKVFGAYSDEITTVVRPKAPQFSAKSNSSGALSVSWERKSGITGYEVTVIGYGNKSHTVEYETGDSHYETGLNSGETYRIKMRCYIEYNGQRVYSAYTDVRKVDVI